MTGSCQHCGAQLAVGAVACFRCGRMVARADDSGTGAGLSLVVEGTHLGTVAKSELLEDQWRLVKLLGQGAVGEVWQAHDITLDRPVAVKRMHAAIAADPSQVARFEREARVLAGLEHANLLPVLGIGRSGDRPFLVTRLLEGRTLAELVHQRGGRLPAAEAARVLVPICEALDCLHAAGVVHRDLKPSNVFVGDDGRVTLMDLGSALEANSELTRFGEVLGTQGYLSPEQKLGKRTLDGKSDVFALGCLLVEVLTGKVAGEGASLTSPGVPRALLELARFAMALAPADRPTALELRAKLVPYLATEEATAPMGAPLKAELPTQHVVFTPTTGSPEYPHLRVVPAVEPETKEAPRVLATSDTVQLPLSAAVSDLPRARLTDAGAAPALATDAGKGADPKRAVATRMMTASPRPSARVPRSVIALGVLTALAILGAVSVGLTERPPEVPVPMRVDKPHVAAPIQKEELKIVAIVDLPKPDRVVLVPNIDDRKVELYTGGLERSVARKPNRKSVGLGLLRVTTTINDFVVPSVMWIKRRPTDKVYELVGRTPVELQVQPGELAIRLQYGEDPVIHLPYRVLPRSDWPKEAGGMRLEIGVRPSTESDDGVSRGEFDAQGVTRPGQSGKPMTQRNAKGGR